MRNKVWLKIGKFSITYPYRQKIIKQIGNETEAARVFFRCVHSNPKNPMGWIAKGLEPDKDGKRYAFSTHNAEYEPNAFNFWYATVWNKQGQTNVRTEEKDFKSLINGLISKAKK